MSTHPTRLVRTLLRPTLLAAVLLLAHAGPGRAQTACLAPAPICTAAKSVYSVASYDPQASGVLVAPGRMVTNRHVVADEPKATVILPDGRTVAATVVPSAYPGDLILLDVPALRGAPAATPAGTAATEPLYVIGTDIGRGAVRSYAPGTLIVPPAETPLARLHTDAESYPGNSGGALVDAEGRLVGILASGGEGRNEAIPASEIARLQQMSGSDQTRASSQIGAAYRACDAALEAAHGRHGPMTQNQSRSLADLCIATENRQLMDLAGQALGRGRRLDLAIELFEASLEQDPNAPNTLVSLAVTLHLARRYADAIPHLRRLLEILPNDPQVLRLAVQAGKWGGDETLSKKALLLMQTHHPEAAPMARKFLNAPGGAPTAPR